MPGHEHGVLINAPLGGSASQRAKRATPAVLPAMTEAWPGIQNLEARLRKVERKKEMLKKDTALLTSGPSISSIDRGVE